MCAYTLGYAYLQVTKRTPEKLKVGGGSPLEVLTRRGHGMAYTDYLLRFRAMSSADLAVKQAALEAKDTILSQQSMGSKAFTRDLRLLQDQLNAIAYVLKERSATTIIKPIINHGIGITDFSEVR